MALNPRYNDEFEYIIAYQPGAVNKCTLIGTIGAYYVPTSCLGNLDPNGRRKCTFVQRPGDQFTSVVTWPFEDWGISTEYFNLRFYCVDEIVLVEEPNERVFKGLNDYETLSFVPEKFKKQPQYITGRTYELWDLRLGYCKYRMLVDKETREMYFDHPIRELMLGVNLKLEYLTKYNMELINKTFN